MDPDRLLREVCLSQLSPDLDFWSDASGVGWGTHLGPGVIPGLWYQEETALSINSSEWLAVERGLLHFRSSVNHSTVAVFTENSTAVAYLHNAGGHLISSPQFHCPAYPQRVRTPPCSPGSQFIMERHNVLAGSLSLLDQIEGLAWTLPMEVFWPMAGHSRPVCYLSKSPLLHIFIALPRTSGDGDGRPPTVLGPSPGLLVPSLGYDSTGPPQPPIVVRSCAD